MSLGVVIPVFNALVHLRRCVESVRLHTSDPYRLVLVNDASTDPGVSVYLEELRLNTGATVMERKTNGGFAAAVNTGLEAVEGDAVLLNSDTVVTTGWDRKLRQAAYSREGVATVTPLTNAAGFLSVPYDRDSPLPGYVDPETMNALVEAVSERRRPETPSGCGFCLYVTAAALSKVGRFDEDRFPKGYGEENDFCFRASQLGFTHLMDDATFVYHHGRASFGAGADELRAIGLERLAELHPWFGKAISRFVERDELGAIRAALLRELEQRQRSQLSVTFVLPHQRQASGGAWEMEEYARRLSDRFTVSIVVEKGEPRPVPGVRVTQARFLSPEELPDADVLLVYGSYPFGEQVAHLPVSKGRPVLWLAGYLPNVAKNLRAFDHVFALSPWLASEAESNGCAARLVERPLDREFWRVGEPTEERNPIVSMMTHPMASKGTKDGLEALSRVTRRVPGVEINLFGTGAVNPAFPAQTMSALSTDGVAELFRKSAVVVVPSWEEGFGLPGLEAIASGAALATTDTKGSRSYASDGETALVTPPGRPDLLADSVCLLLRDPALRARLTAKARAHIDLSFPSWEEATDRLAEQLIGLAATSLEPPGEPPAAKHSPALYIDLLKNTLTASVHQERPTIVRDQSSVTDADTLEALRRSQIVIGRKPTPTERASQEQEGRGWPLVAETMVGMQRLDNLLWCLENVLQWGVRGDLIETGVWRGGASIFMRGVLKAYGVSDRDVWVADSFEGLPPPDEEAYPADHGDRHHTHSDLAVDLETVRDNFRRYGLLDDQVKFLPGWFRDTLPTVAGMRWSLIRLDGDMYQSTYEALQWLYPSLSQGGYLIVDDYGALPAAAAAVDDYRKEHGITEAIRRVDWTGVYWRKIESADTPSLQPPD